MADKSTDPTELLHLARGGSPDGLNQLLEHYRNYLMILARTHIGRILQAKADPSDLVQDTLIEAQRDFAQFRGSTEDEFAAWLRKMMANNGAKFVRQYKGGPGERRATRATGRRRAGPIDTNDGRTGRAWIVPQPGSHPSGSGRATGQRGGPATGPLSRRDRVAPPARSAHKGRRPRDASHRGQHQEAARPRADPSAIHVKRSAMTQSAEAERSARTRSRRIVEWSRDRGAAGRGAGRIPRRGRRGTSAQPQ